MSVDQPTESFDLEVRTDEIADVDATLQRLVDDRVASRITAKDHTLWGEAAEEESAKRLDWVDLAETSRPLIEEIALRRSAFDDLGLTRVVLCGMGGSSLAPEVICQAAGVPLEVLDSSDPDVVRRAVDTDLDKTVVVVSSKSGGTVETDSQRRAYEQAFTDAGIDPAERIVVVTDPGSPLQKTADEQGYTVFEANPNVGGRYSALTAFGLVPSGLAGADIKALLDGAADVSAMLAADDPANPGLLLGALIGAANHQGIDKLVLADAGSPYPGLGDWVEQLVAESTGKDGKGVLPVVVEGTTAPNFEPATPDELLTTYGVEAPTESRWHARLGGPLGSQMLVWEYATAVVGRVIGINPFDQPDVESAKQAARDMLEGGLDAPEPTFVDGDVQVFASGDWLPADTATYEGAIGALLEQLDQETGYLAVQAYLDRERDESFAGVRADLARRTGRPVTFGWGPRFLHSTGQYHKGGPATGVFVQVTADPEQDLEIPGRPFTFGDFIIAQAVGDGSVLAKKGCPVLRLHLTDLAALSSVADALAGPA